MHDDVIDAVIVEEDAFTEEDAEFLAEMADESAEDEAVPCTEDANLRRIAELEEKLQAAEAEMARRQREFSCRSLLSEAGLPGELAPAVMTSEDMAHTVELIRGAVKNAVAEEMRLRCRSGAPEKGKGVSITREELLRLPVAELQSLWR